MRHWHGESVGCEDVMWPRPGLDTAAIPVAPVHADSLSNVPPVHQPPESAVPLPETVMTRRSLAWLLAAGLALTLVGSSAAPPDEPVKDAAPLPSVEEARQRAKLLHGTIHDTLQIVHARYFREGERLMIPAATLKDVFKEVEGRDGVKLRWLVVEGRAMNVDHEPQDEFEEAAARALASGEDRYELSEDGVYRFAGPITLGADCLKCHLPNRSNNDDRTAGLLISMPIGK